MIAKLLKYFKKSPLLAFIKSEPTFLTGSLAVCLSAPVQGEAGGRGGGGGFRPPSPASSGRVFLNRHRNTKIGTLYGFPILGISLMGGFERAEGVGEPRPVPRVGKKSETEGF